MSDGALERAERRLTEARADARALAATNDRLNATLREARETLQGLRDQLDALGRPPQQVGVVVGASEAGLADVVVGGRRLRAAVAAPELSGASLQPGSVVLLNEAMVVVGLAAPEAGGDLVRMVELLPDGRAVVSGGHDERWVAVLAPALADDPPAPGDALLADARAHVAFERVPTTPLTELTLDEVPDVTWDDIGGLAEQIEQVRDAVELPFTRRDLFEAHDLAAPRGVLLHGPPGCGKTMVAKAVARAAGSAFLNVKGPELLNKYVGETERLIRVTFERARELAEDGRGVIVFFDEMDSLFRTRGSGVSSDVESTVVPQLLAEIDGVEALRNVLVIGATNREDLIDPAILRPGRLDVKIRFDRPTEAGAREILTHHLPAGLPWHPDEVTGAGSPEALRDAVVARAASRLYARDEGTGFVEVTYASGARETLHVADFVSGAMLANIARRAKLRAVKDELAGHRRGLRAAHVLAAVTDEVEANEELPSTTNPDDWARVSGRRGERIVFLRTLGPGGRGTRALEGS